MEILLGQSGKLLKTQKGSGKSAVTRDNYSLAHDLVTKNGEMWGREMKV